MSKKVYNKLVRSEIPTIIKSEEKSCTYVELDASDEEQKDMVIRLLKEKIVEEANEVLNATNRGDMLEEIGDLFEVVDELISLHSTYMFDKKDLEKEISTIRAAKNIKKGCFLKKTRGQAVYNMTYIKLLSVDNE